MNELNILGMSFKKPTKEQIEAIRNKELEELTKQSESYDKNTVLGMLEIKRLRLEYVAVRDDKDLDYYKKIHYEDDLVPTVTDELTEYGTVCEQIKRVKQSNLGQLIDKYRMQSFRDNKPHHKLMKERALSFVEEPTSCFATLGQSGSGKSHICTALATELMLKRNATVKYMIWSNEIQDIKSEWETRQSKIDKLKEVDVLYIDDFLKITGNDTKQSDSDIAFEILNDRYNHNKITIISSEHMLEELMDIDTALAGRIAEMSQGYVIQIGRDNKKNERLSGIHNV